MNANKGLHPGAAARDLAGFVEDVTIGLQACDFVLSIADMKKDGPTVEGLAQFEADALRFLGVRRFPDEPVVDFLDRIASWPADGFIPAMRRNGIPMKVADDFLSDFFTKGEGK